MRRIAASVLMIFAPLLFAQQRKESLVLRLQLNPAADELHNDVTVRLYNTSERIVNVYIPLGLACAPAPGALWLKWTYKPAQSQALAAQGLHTSCGLNVPGADTTLLRDRLAKQQQVWKALRPGEYVDIHDTISTAAISEMCRELRGSGRLCCTEVLGARETRTEGGHGEAISRHDAYGSPSASRVAPADAPATADPVADRAVRPGDELRVPGSCLTILRDAAVHRRRHRYRQWPSFGRAL
jgi:hypothetical protein